MQASKVANFTLIVKGGRKGGRMGSLLGTLNLLKIAYV